MDRKNLTVLLAVVCITMTACGKESEVQIDDYTSDAPAGYGISDGPATEAAVNEFYQEEPENEMYAEEEEITETESEVPEVNGPEGIITLVAYPNNSYGYCINVYAVDVTGNSSQSILSLQLPLVKAGNEYGYIIPIDNPRFGNLQDQFSPDFSKMVATRARVSDRSMHCGWIDQSGEFFDVTEALGEAEASDFDDPVHYHAIGFMDNGATFVYEEVSDTNNGYWFDTLGYYAVSVENIESNTPWELDPSSTYLHDGDSWKWLGDYRPSDWTDETHFYTDTGSKKNPCVIVDIAAQTMSEFLPGETRRNWSVVASPDGQQIAFMSRSESGPSNSAELYVMSLDDMSHNRQLLTINSPSDARTMSIYGELTDVDTLCVVLDWRQ